MGALVCNYLLDEASREHKFLAMKRQDGHLQFDPKWNDLRSDVAALRGCWWHFEEPIFEAKVHENRPTLSKIKNYFSLALGFKSIGPLILISVL
jgi:hypothetical protein